MKRFVLPAGIALIGAILIPLLWLGTGDDEVSVTTASNIKQNSETMVVYMSPQCGCCGVWVDHVEEHGFTTETRKTDAVNAIKEEAGLPRDLVSCHTGFIDGYLIEGHVPASDIQRLLEERPDAAGLSVPRMPIGSPGMEIEGEGREAFDVVLFRRDGSREVFNHYPAQDAL